MARPSVPEIEVLPQTGDEASLRTSRSRRSFAATLRRRTSILLGRNTTTITPNTADNTPLPVHPEPLRGKRSWFHSARFQRHNHTALDSSESSQDVCHAELEEGSGLTNPPPSPEISPTRSPGERRHTFRGRLRLHSLPARIRRRGAALFRRTSMSNPSDEDKENFPVVLDMPPPAAVNASNMGSWSSFRSGVQRAVREMVDGNFRFAEEHGGRRPPPARSSERVPLRTLWTIMSADSSEGHASGATSPPPQPTKPYKLSSPGNFCRNWSPTSSSRYMAVSQSSNGGSEEDSAGGVTPDSGSSPVVSTVHSPASERPSQESRASLLGSSIDDEENVAAVPPGARNRTVKGFEAGVNSEGEEEAWAQAGDELVVRKGDVKARVVSHPAGVV